MKITGAIEVGSKGLKDISMSNICRVDISIDGHIEGLSWNYDSGLISMAKRLGGKWDGNRWEFPNQEQANSMIGKIQKLDSNWSMQKFINGKLERSKSLLKTSFSFVDIGSSKSAIVLPFPLPNTTDVDLLSRQKCFKVFARNNNAAILVVGPTEIMNQISDDLEEQGATRDQNILAKSFGLINTKTAIIKVKVSGWAVEIQCSLFNPLHYLIKPEQKYKWEGTYPYGTQVATKWDGRINITRKLWSSWKQRIEEVGLAWEGDDPSAEMVLNIDFDPSLIPGWSSPSANGHFLHEYQKEGAEFCVKRSMRALIADEMGVGKTAQAIAAVEVVRSKRIVIICPANARYVWDREIKEWSLGGEIQHINNQLDNLDLSARWHIITYDQLVVRIETWKVLDEMEERAIILCLPQLADQFVIQDKYPKKIKLDQYSSITPDFANVKRVDAWQRTMRRLKGELLNQILDSGPCQLIVDEAHRIKNRDSKRTKAIQRITESESRVLLLTGTPLRNNEHEAAVLLSCLDTNAANDLSKKKGYTIQDVKDYLGYFMIRRTKQEVLPQLPVKTRQRVDIQLNDDLLEDYTELICMASEYYLEAIKNGATESKARKAVQGLIEQARKSLGIAKVNSGLVADLVFDVVENKDCCVVFCAHHQASDTLCEQLNKEGVSAEVVDGRTAQKERARIVSDFQDGKLDVFIGGINSAGEAITLTRSDTVVFAELDWVPAALMQAEDRIHRVGQKENCQVIQLIARIRGVNLDEDMIEVLGSKLERIGNVLDESTENIIESQGSLMNEIIDRLLGKSNARKKINSFMSIADKKKLGLESTQSVSH